MVTTTQREPDADDSASPYYPSQSPIPLPLDPQSPCLAPSQFNTNHFLLFPPILNLIYCTVGDTWGLLLVHSLDHSSLDLQHAFHLAIHHVTTTCFLYWCRNCRIHL